MCWLAKVAKQDDASSSGQLVQLLIERTFFFRPRNALRFPSFPCFPSFLLPPASTCAQEGRHAGGREASKEACARGQGRKQGRKEATKRKQARNSGFGEGSTNQQTQKQSNLDNIGYVQHPLSAHRKFIADPLRIPSDIFTSPGGEDGSRGPVFSGSSPTAPCFDTRPMW